MRLVNPKASTFLAILEIFCSGVCVRELLAYGTSAPIGRITSFSAKFTDAPLAEGKFETYLHERENAKKPRLARPRPRRASSRRADIDCSSAPGAAELGR